MAPQTQGIALYVLAVFMFGTMDALAKLLTDGYPVGQVMFFRAAFGTLALVPLVMRGPGLRKLRSTAPWMQLLRGLFIVGTLTFFFLSLRYLGLAEATAITLAAPIFMTVLGVTLMGDRIGLWRSAAVLVGFGGVLIMVRPGSEAFQPAALLALAAALTYAFASLLTRRVVQYDDALSTAFFGNVLMLVGAIVALLWGWKTPTGGDLTLFIALGMTGGIANYVITLALARCTLSTAAPLEYLILVWATAYGYLFWQELPTVFTLSGAALIIAASLTITLRGRSGTPTTPAEL